MNRHRVLLDAMFAGAVLAATAPAFAQTQVNVADPTTSSHKQAVDSSGNASVANKATTSGGATRICTNQILATATACGSSAPHQVYTFELDNTLNTLPTWFQIFDLAVSSVTLGSTTASAEIEVPPGALVVIPVPVGDAFGTAVTIACTTSPTNATAPASKCGYTLWGQ